ncbi:RagB/SusD family nutrient uptake outer membrane protein [Halalkalibaculum sp. DA3122]|uniref:RagB/SusD family nutrient uptake outer membrane protein n=1 Tax=Halalkalibaculum sp. DA3122 TaxID=3373607 RepID=UPI0037542767
MKNLIFKQFFFLFCIAVIVTSCDDQILNKKPLDQISEEDLWNDPALVESYVNDIYQGVGHGFFAVNVSSGVDETIITHGWNDTPIKQSNMTPDELGLFGDGAVAPFDHFHWDDLYGNIRSINVFLENIGESPVEQSLKDRLTGEVHFLRAYFYHNLVKLYGGVPIIKESFNLDDDFLVERDSFEDCINFIVEDLDAAASLLPTVIEGDKAHASKGAALALKSRILTYAASDLYAQNPSGNDYTGYTGGDQTQRWERAKAAAEAVMDLGYSLYQADPAPGDSTAKNYADLFLQKDHEEIIFARYFLQNQSYEWYEADMGLFHGPNGWHNWGGDTPLGQMVDAYEMEDGTEFNWQAFRNGDPAYGESPYENRDPRFYASIFYNGSQWRERPADMIDLDPEGIVETASFEVEGQSDLRPGLDTRDGPIEDWNGTYTGYYMRKFLDPNVDHQFFRQEVPWIFIRYAEILLNYAEASIELDEEGDARTALNAIRERAGMPDIPATETGQDLMERYRNERRIELAFEDHRYFDVRRWMIAPDVYENGEGVNIIGRLNNNGSYTFEYNIVEIDQRQWNDNAYFLPIPRYEMERNENLEQNPGYN